MAARLVADTAPDTLLRWQSPLRPFDGMLGRLAAWAGAIESRARPILQGSPEPDRLVNNLRRAGLL